MVYDSRLLKGTLTFGPTGTPTAFECQVTNVVVEQQDGDTEDAVTVLCGDQVGGTTQPGPWHITGTVIQDFDSPAATNITKFSYDHRNTEQPFSFTPNDSTAAPTITGTVQVKFLGLGGDTNARITRDFDWAITDEPVFAWGTGTGATEATTTEGQENPSETPTEAPTDTPALEPAGTY